MPGKRIYNCGEDEERRKEVLQGKLTSITLAPLKDELPLKGCTNASIHDSGDQFQGLRRRVYHTATRWRGPHFLPVLGGPSTPVQWAWRLWRLWRHWHDRRPTESTE